LQKKDVDLTVHDLDKNPLSNEEILKLMTKGPGQMRGPVIVVDDDKVVLGYNKDRLEELVP
jgi:arsenate reductase-like glutaredoxin family protein